MAVGSPFSGTSLHAFEKRSMITRMVVKPLEVGKSVINLWINVTRDGEEWAEAVADWREVHVGSWTERR